MGRGRSKGCVTTDATRSAGRAFPEAWLPQGSWHHATALIILGQGIPALRRHMGQAHSPEELVQRLSSVPPGALPAWRSARGRIELGQRSLPESPTRRASAFRSTGVALGIRGLAGPGARSPQLRGRRGMLYGLASEYIYTQSHDCCTSTSPLPLFKQLLYPRPGSCFPPT